ncbi:MAG: type II toxin-antitoxin system RelE/ParE family toxin [Bacteroidetes bacterium]|nr:type II toxin-antitoxin system RelE/ParE family toxin [Bacteroidota bacterium]
MQVLYQKRFLKDLSLVPHRSRKEIENFVFEVLPDAATIAELSRFEKMTGYEYCFKARFGSYRIGAYYKDNVLELRRVLHRKEIYRYFP